MSETARPQPGAVPFDEAIRFLRGKVNVPTDRWRDLTAEQYSAGFAVAGVRDMQALQAIRVAIDRALADGTTLAEFRRDLRGIIDRTGLTLRGEFGWRSRTIFETNLRTAYAAGRWAQIQRLKDARPYLRYEAVLDNRTRPMHRGWHGTVLPVDHEFWQTHYPPNGWGCRCTVRSLSERDLRRYGYTITDPPPPSGRLPRSVRTPDGNRIVELPPGIDEGWDHNVGEAERLARGGGTLPGWDAPLRPSQIAPPPELPPMSLSAAAATGSEAGRLAARRVADALLRVNADIGAAFAERILPAVVPMMQAEFALWAAARLQAGQPSGTYRVIGALTRVEVAALREASRPPATAAIWVTDAQLLHLARSTKAQGGRALGVGDALRLPELMAAREAVLLDLTDGELLFVFTPADPAEARRGKIVVRSGLTYRTPPERPLGRGLIQGAGVVTAGLVERITLADRRRYRVISGSLE